MQWLFLLAAIIGTLLPLSFVMPFLTTHGLDLPLFCRLLFQNNVSAFFGVDVIITSFVLWLFVFAEGRRRGMRHLWVYILCSLLVGLSLALPLFLFFRERKLNAAQPA